MADDWYLPSWIPKNSKLISALLILNSCITSTTFGYDGSMLNGLNILTVYKSYFHLNNAALQGLMTASIWIGGILAAVTYGRITDAIGRRPAMFWAAVMTLAAVVLQTTSQGIAMFVISRILIGLGTTASGLAGPVWLAETLPTQTRAWGVGLFNDFYYVGAIIAGSITYGTRNMHSTWAWRIPSLVQGLFSIICIVLLPFVPESPRWLVYRNRVDEARYVVALTYANGDLNSNIVLAQFKQIQDTIEYEKSVRETQSLQELLKTKSARKRVALASSCAIFSTIAGNVAASYYLGDMLDNAGVTDQTAQLEINIYLNIFCLFCALGGTFLADKWGRIPLTVLSTALLTGFLFIIGILTKIYGESTSHSGIYGTVASIFLFQGAYSIGWTPILYLYPPEVLHYPIRANGMAVFQFFLNGTALLFVFCMPIALQNIGWKMYMVNGAWDVLIVFAVAYFWVETKGRTLEEIDEVMKATQHGDAVINEDINGFTNIVTSELFPLQKS